MDRYKQLLLKQRDIMIALTARLNERDETIIQLQEELDAYERIHRDTENALEKRQDRILQLEQVMQLRGVEIPFDEEGADRPLQLHHHHLATNEQQLTLENGGEQARKYLPHEQFHLGGKSNQNEEGEEEEEEDVPLQLMTADEKVDELQQVLERRELELAQLREQAEEAVRPEQLKERVEQIVQREVEERVRLLQQAMQVQMQQNQLQQNQQPQVVENTNAVQQVQYMEK